MLCINEPKSIKKYLSTEICAFSDISHLPPMPDCHELGNTSFLPLTVSIPSSFPTPGRCIIALFVPKFLRSFQSRKSRHESIVLFLTNSLTGPWVGPFRRAGWRQLDENTTSCPHLQISSAARADRMVRCEKMFVFVLDSGAKKTRLPSNPVALWFAC